MGQALYRKYRSKSLSEVIGQEHITKTLEQAIKSGRISHAYLFTGPKGVGKTSVARIFAHDINGLEYDDDLGHLDIIEIDAASNRKLEETKALIERVYVAPVSAKYKVYIIDEVHMLTRESFNALLKTLEEPPEHVVYILATTELQKMPETIVSRTQRFVFKPIKQEKVVKHLASIAKHEGIKIDAKALEMIAEHGQGSFRDSIALLDQAANYAQPISETDISTLLGIPPSQLIEELIDALSKGDLNQVIVLTHDLIEQGYPATSIATRLSKELRQKLIDDQSPLASDLALKLLEDLLDVGAATNPETYLEICLLKALPQISAKPSSVSSQLPDTESVKEIQPTYQEPPAARKHESKSLPKPTDEKNSINAKTEKKLNDKNGPNLDSNMPVTSSKTAAPVEEEKVTLKTKATQTMDKDSWNDVLGLLRSSHNTLYGVVRMASLDFDSAHNIIRLKFAYQFHKNRVNEPKNLSYIQSAIKKVSGQSYVIECVIDQSLLDKEGPGKEAESNKLETISSIFGGGELI